jgi:preprotein translocase subunit SecD
MTDELDWVRSVRPQVEEPSREAEAAARQALERAIAKELPRPRRRLVALPALRLSQLVPIAAVLVVVAVVAVFLSVHSRNPAGSAGRAGLQLVFQAEPTPQTPVVTRASLARAIAVMRERAEALGVAGASFSASGGNQVMVQLPGVTNLARAEREFGTTARLELYDWEANALTPNGHTVASQLQAQDRSAVLISQGTGTLAPGTSNAGGLSLYDAVKLASSQPVEVSSRNARVGSEYYLFGTGGSAACTAAAHHYGVATAPGMHCLLAGPDANAEELIGALPPGVGASTGQRLAVKQGTVVLQAMPSSPSSPPRFADPTSRFYVLKDRVALFGNEITKPQQSTDSSGSPDVEFGFTPTGANEFQTVTSEIAHRGDLVSALGRALEQHFAVAIDSQLITVPFIDFKQLPDGLPAAHGATIPGGLTRASARELATELRLGALPVNLRLILAERLSTSG